MLKLAISRNLFLSGIAFLACALHAQSDNTKEEIVTNQTVIQMVNAKLPTDLIITKIQTSSKTDFDLSTDGLLGLSRADVPGEVIKTMLRRNCRSAGCAEVAVSDSSDPTLPHAPGIYVYSPTEGGPKLTLLEPTVYSRTKTTGELASTITLGLAQVRSRAVLNGASAGIRIRGSKPVFYFYFEQKSTLLSCKAFCGNSTPHEFTLLRFDIKGNARETLISKYNIVGSSRGVPSKSAVPFVFENIKPGIYKVTVENRLEPGEYCFFSNAAVAYHGRLFDFGVDP
jgi:hypothetical protein